MLPWLNSRGNFIFGSFRDGIFLFPLQLSLFCFACWGFFVFFLFICLSPLSLPLPTSPAWVDKRRSHWRATDTFPLPGAARGDPDPAAGRGKAASRCHLLTCFCHRPLRGLFSVILGKKQEVAGGTVISLGPEKVGACSGVRHPNPGLFGLFA